MGELTGIDYSDSTPDVSFSYTRTGQQATVTDAVGTRTFGYNSKLQLESEAIVGGLYSRLITRKYETYGGQDGSLAGRNRGFMIGDSGDLDEDYDTRYEYDSKGRLQRVTGPGMDGDYGVTYARFGDSDMVQYVRFNK